ncbi:hypothetical protein D3C78_1548020 [compost metagenome]
MLDPVAAAAGGRGAWCGLGQCCFEHGFFRLQRQQFIRLHVRQAGRQQLRLGSRHQQLLRAINRHALLERRVELQHLVFINLGQSGYTRQVQAILDGDGFEIGFVGNRVEVYAVRLRRHDHL